MATAATLLTRAQAYGYGTDTATQQLEALNEEVRELYLERKWQWREATTTLTATIGNNAVALTAGIGQVLTVRLQDSTVAAYDLEWLEPEDFRDIEQGDIPAENGRPSYWTRFANALRLWPRPDKAYTVVVDYVIVRTADLASGDEVPLPYEYEDIVVYGVVYRMAIRQRDFQLAEWAYGKRGELFALAAKDDDNRQRQRESIVVQSPSRWQEWNEQRDWSE
jgi:hypothetical protein